MAIMDEKKMYSEQELAEMQNNIDVAQAKGEIPRVKVKTKTITHPDGRKDVHIYAPLIRMKPKTKEK